MKYKIKIITGVIILLFLFTGKYSTAQRYQFERYEAVLGVGTTTLFGDIGGLSTRTALSLGARYTIQHRLSTKVSLDFGWGFGKDDGSDNETRGYKYNTFILEPTIQIEFFFFKTKGTRYNRKGYRLEVPRFGTYGFVGIGGLYFKPTPGGDFVDDFDDDFSNFSIVFPAGIGIQVGVAKGLMIGIEIGGRYARTDYIDGYSSDYSTSLDVYYLTLLNAAYRFSSFSFKRGFE
jgi:hypothetical protein